MKRLFPAMFIILSVALAACQTQSSPPPATPATEAVAAPTRQTEPTKSPAPSEVSSVGSSSSPGCTVESSRTSPDPTEQSLFPPVSDQDWVDGPNSASVTLIEYSDFQ